MTSLFITVTGQEDNLGDSLLRRGYLQSVRSLGELHVLTGYNSPGYVTGLGLSDVDIAYADRGAWERRLVREALLGRRPVLLLNAGEARISDGHEYVGGRLDLLAKLVSARGGRVVQTGLGVREGIKARPSARLLKFLKRADLVTWRDPESHAAVGIGSVAPDWAFALEVLEADAEPEARPYLAVSMRGDRPAPDAAWLAAVDGLARKHALTPLLVTQVQRDNERAHEIASLLESVAEVRAWNDTSHATRLKELEDIYASCRAIVSDRLHALVLAASRGAVPVGLSTGSAEKLKRTLSPAHLDDWCFDAEAVSTAVDIVLPPSTEILERHRLAGAELRRVTSALEKLAAV